MHCHVAAEALFRRFDGIGSCLRFRSGFCCRFFCGSFSAGSSVDGLQDSIGGDCCAGQRFNPVLAVSKRCALADKLVRKGRFGGPLAQARGFVGRIDAQRLNLVAVQRDMHRHVAAKALFNRFDGVAGRRRFFLCFRLRGRIFRRFCGRFFRLLRFRFRGVFTGNCPVDRLQCRVGRHSGAGKCFDAVLTESEGAGLSDKLLSKLRFGSPFAQAFGFVRRIDGQFAYSIVLCRNVYRYLPAETLLGRLCGSSRAVGC